MKQLRALNFGIQSVGRLGIGVFLSAAIAVSAGAVHPQPAAADACSDQGQICYNNDNIPYPTAPVIVSASITTSATGTNAGHVTYRQNDALDYHYNVCANLGSNPDPKQMDDHQCVDAPAPGAGNTATVTFTGLKASSYCFYLLGNNPNAKSTWLDVGSDTVCATPSGNATAVTTAPACAACGTHEITTPNSTTTSAVCAACGAQVPTTVSTTCAVCSSTQKPRLHPGS